MSDLIQLRIATDSADREAEILEEGVPVWDRELERLFIHDGSTAGGLEALGSAGFVPQYKEQGASTGDTVTVYFRPQTSGNTLLVTLAVGAGVFEKPVILSRETRADGAGSGVAVAGGTRLTVCVLCTTTSAGRVVEICDNAVENVLDTLASDTEGAFSVLLEYVFTGTAWIKLGSARQV